MGIRKRIVAGLVADADHDIGVVGLGSKYGRVVRIDARNYASSAKAGAGTDTAQKLKLTDATGAVFFLDAADRDYATAKVKLAPVLDDTATGLGILGVDGTGAVRAAGEAGQPPVVQGPVTVTVLNGGTPTDYFEAELFVETV